MESILNKRNEGVKVYFSLSELKSKPIMFWNNVGNIHKYSTYNKWIKNIKKIIGQHTGNGISYLTYYARRSSIISISL